jgi:polyvinyl alcohol dehydrogenase (cytochrome)
MACPFLCQGVLALSLVLAPSVARDDDPADWQMYNHDVLGSRHNPFESVLTPATVGGMVELWRFPAEGSGEEVGVIHATPSVVGGEVYFGTATAPSFYKLAADGRVL